MHCSSAKIVLAASMALLITSSAAGQHQNTHQQDEPELDPPLPENLTLDETLDYAADDPPDSWPDPIHDNPVLSFTLFELLEQRISDDLRDELGWDAQGWIGNDDHKFWWRTEGEAILDGSDEGEADLQALYARPLSAFWYMQAGIRYDQTWSQNDTKERVSAVLGLQGLAPYKFDLEPSLYLTDDGDLLGQMTASYDLYLTQRLVLQPRTEFNLSAADVPEYELGAGFNDINFELRLRYEIEREIAPYIGLRYTTFLGETADVVERSGEETEDFQIVFGLRFAF